MYSSISEKIDLLLSQNILKKLVSGVADNLAEGAFSMIALSTLFSIATGTGSVGSSVIMGRTCYAMTLASGYIYLKIMTQLFSKGIDPTTRTKAGWRQDVNRAARDRVTQDFMEATHLRRVIFPKQKSAFRS